MTLGGYEDAPPMSAGSHPHKAWLKKMDAAALLFEISLSIDLGMSSEGMLRAEMAELRRRIEIDEWSLPVPDDVAMLLLQEVAT